MTPCIRDLIESCAAATEPMLTYRYENSLCEIHGVSVSCWQKLINAGKTNTARKKTVYRSF